MAIDELLDEHEQGERVRSWLRQNALGIIGGLALGIAAIYGWRWWGTHQAQQQYEAHGAYAKAVEQLEAGQVDQAGALLAGQKGVYATLAALRVAKAQVEAGKTEEALATLRGIQAEPGLKSVVDERIAQLLNATGKPGEALDLLAGDAGSIALELRGDALFASEGTRAAISQPYLSYGDKGYWGGVPDYQGVDDATVFWWDPNATGLDEVRREGTGMYQYVDGGQRYLPGEWPTEDKLFNPDGAIEVGTQNDTGSTYEGACAPPPMRQASPTGSP